jgi:DNA polymerase I-like protein with 3'-5' exonuclease and polymerase domains
MYNLFYLHGIDLLALQEIEYNGILYEQKQSEVLANELDEQIGKLDRRLYEYHRQDDFNLNSNDHLSSLLYGGSISFKRKVDDGFYKSGAKKGEPKQKWETYEVEFPRLVNPLKGSELKKEGYYSTDEKTLKMLKGAKELIDLLLARAVLQKRLTTYYRGLNELITESNWDYGMIHGQLNQCVARTGRLSSSKPNLQNFDGEIKTLFTSRYKEA